MEKIELTAEELQEKIDEAVAGLKNKNKEILGKLKKTKQALNKFDGLSVDDIEEQQAELEQLKEQLMTEEERKEALLNRKNTELQEVKDKLEEAKKQAQELQISSAISSAIASAGKLNEGMAEPVNLFLKNKAQLDGDAVLIENKDIKEFVKEWSKKDGKNFFDTKTLGAGAPGSGSGISNFASYFDKKSDDYNLTEQIKVKKTNPELYEQLKKQYK
jgi:DNA repair exonuclease SbcCD ATPase subunit